MGKLGAYYQLTKPGIVYGNLLSVIAGFFIAATGTNVHWGLFIAVMAGVALVIAASCVFNNYLDRNIDSKMKRTSKRALVQGTIPTRSALLYATVLAVWGFVILGVFVNILTLLLGVLAMQLYVIVYGYVKRRSWHGTLVGTIPGALPIVAGYTAVTNELDALAWTLFLFMAIWQMPHFYAIAIYRKDEYAAAGIPVVSIVKGVRFTKITISIYITILAVFMSILLFLSVFPTVYGFEINLFAVILFVFILIIFRWLYIALSGFSSSNDNKWARQVFGFSLIVLLGFCSLGPLSYTISVLSSGSGV
ncbi:MAG: heme o synthase [Candidatus Saccharimonadales bacterium]